MYRKYIRTGQISVEQNRDGKPQIDTSELLRVVGAIHVGTAADTQKEQSDTGMYNDVIRAELAACQEALRLAREEIAWLRSRVEAAEQKLLAGPETKRRWWWPWQ